MAIIHSQNAAKINNIASPAFPLRDLPPKPLRYVNPAMPVRNENPLELMLP